MPDSSNNPDAIEEEENTSPGTMADWSDALRDVAPFLDLGSRIAATVALPPLFGYAVDVALGTLPWGVLAGCTLGLLGAGVLLAYLGPEMERRRARHEKDEASSSHDESDLQT